MTPTTTPGPLVYVLVTSDVDANVATTVYTDRDRAMAAALDYLLDRYDDGEPLPTFDSTDDFMEWHNCTTVPAEFIDVLPTYVVTAVTA